MPKEREIVFGSSSTNFCSRSATSLSRTYRPIASSRSESRCGVAGDVVGELPHLGHERWDHQQGEQDRDAECRDEDEGHRAAARAPSALDEADGGVQTDRQHGSHQHQDHDVDHRPQREQDRGDGGDRERHPRPVRHRGPTGPPLVSVRLRRGASWRWQEWTRSPAECRPTPRAVSTTRYAPPAMERFDVVIVGGGPMGTAAARTLSARGRAVVLLERFTLGNDRGSTAGTTRNFRLTYHDPVYVRMARLALERWRELEDRSGQELLRVVGGLDVGEATEASAAALEDAGERFERPSDAEVAERWPMLTFPPGSSFVYQPDGAVLRSREAVKVLASLAVGHGAGVREETRVESITAVGDGVEVTTRDGADPGAGRDRRGGRMDGPAPRASWGSNWTCDPPWNSRRTSMRTRASVPTVIDWDETPRGASVHRARPVRTGENQGRRAPVGPARRPRDAIVRGRRARGATGRRLGRPPPRVSGFRAQDGDVPVHEDTGRRLRAGPGRTARGRLTLQRSRVQVRAADRRGPRRLGRRCCSRISLERFRVDRPAVRP